MDSHSANSPCSFRPTINRRSRRLTSGLLSVQERQQFDLARRETHHKELVAKVEAERQLTETFKPTTNRQIRSGMGIDRSQSALIKKTNISDPEETFHPVINTKSERIATTHSNLQNNQKHTQEVRQRVQGLWREFADIGSGEMTLNGVHCVLKELGLNASSSMVEKFLLALGINESLDIRCVSYDRFMKVFTVVLRAALVTPPHGENNTNNNNNNNNNRVKQSALILSSEGENVQRQSSIHSQDSAPTMRRSHSMRSSTPKRSTVKSNYTIPKKSTMVSQQSVDIQETNMGFSHYKEEQPHDDNNNDSDNNNSDNNSNSNDDGNSPLPVAPHETMRLKDNKNISRRISERSQGLSSSMHQQDSEKRTRKKTYDPLNGCTFAPLINKNYRSHASSKQSNNESETEGNTSSRKTPTVVYKTREEKEMEECTFAPNTARYHKNRDSLAWWTREPFIETNNETTSRNVGNENETSLECISSKDTIDDNEKTLTHNSYSKAIQKPVVKEQEEGRLRVLSARPAPIAMGFDKAVKRMIEARKNNRPKFEEMLRTSNVETQKPLKPTVVEPFTLQAQSRYLEREQQKPVLYVDVDLPSGKTGRIGVHRGDKAEDLAKGFSQAYQLGDELRERLECVLKEKLNELLRENVQTLWL